MATSIVTAADFDEKVLQSRIPVLVDFWGSWCGPCKMAEPVLVGLADTYAGKALVVKINVDENQALVQKYSVMSIPTSILFKNGAEVGRTTGFAGKENFEELIKKGL